MIVQQWKRNSLSCRACRDKKRRCDRERPCSNCTIRQIRCYYESPDRLQPPPGQKQSPASSASKRKRVASPAQNGDVKLDPKDVLNRLRNLESAVFNQAQVDGRNSPSNSPLTPKETVPMKSHSEGQPKNSARHVESTILCGPTSLNAHLTTVNHFEEAQVAAYMDYVIAKLPPLSQAWDLFSHYTAVFQPNWGVLHIPSTRSLIEDTYKAILADKPPLENILLMYSIFAAATFSWTPNVLVKLELTRKEAEAAFAAFMKLSTTILDNTHRPILASTTALAAISCLTHLATNSRGLSDNVDMLRMKCFVMARSLGVDRLDTARSREERDRNGCNVIELEVQRRVWWNMVASDWLNSFSGGPHEGQYIFQPKYTNVNLPTNVADEAITSTGIKGGVSTGATPLSAFFCRVKLAEVCRQAVDALPSFFYDSKDIDYDIIIKLDKMFRTFLEELPVFFKLDSTSIADSEDVCIQYPVIALHRVVINFAAQTRLCRLHRPYHFEDMGHRQASYYHDACTKAAQTVLELRRQMDDIGAKVGFNPARSWIVMQHVYIAGLILATDVSCNPSSPGAAERRAKVLAACDTLERSTEASSVMEGVQKSLQVLRSTLRKRRQSTRGSSPRKLRSRAHDDSEERNSDPTLPSGSESMAGIQHPTPTESLFGEMNQFYSDQSWDQLWTDFLAAAPDLAVPDWEKLLSDMDATQSSLGLEFQ